MKRSIPTEPAIGEKTKRMLTQFIGELRQNNQEKFHPPEFGELREFGDSGSAVTEKRIKELWENLKKQMSQNSPPDSKT